MISRANEKHCPQRGFLPQLRYALVGQDAPSRAAWRTCDSLKLLQMHTIMVIGNIANAIKSQ